MNIWRHKEQGCHAERQIRARYFVRALDEIRRAKLTRVQAMYRLTTQHPHDNIEVTEARSNVATRVPIPKFASFRCTFVCELRNQRTLASYCSRAALVLKSAFRTRRTNDADFRTAALVRPSH